MSKTSIINYNTSIKSNWIAYLVVAAVIIPLLGYLLLRIYEPDLVRFLMKTFPPSVRQGEVFYIDLVSLARIEMIWIGAFFLFGLLLVLYPPRRLPDVFTQTYSRSKSLYYMMLITSAAFLITIWISNVVLEGFPNSSDEYAYYVQAEMFSRGKWWERAHDLPDFFYINNITQHDGILVSRFPPGWPFLLSISFDIGMAPTLVNPLLAVITLVVLFFFTRRLYDSNVAVWSLVIIAPSGYFIFNSASLFSHTSCLLFTVLFVYSLYRYRENRRFYFALAAGFCLAFVVLIRYYTALLIFVPFLFCVIVEYRWRVIPLFFWMGVGSVPCLAYLLWYNYSITGDALLPVTMWAYPSERLGFVKGHTIIRGIDHLVRRTLLFVVWASPGLILLYVVFLMRKVGDSARRLVHPEDYTFLALAVGYFFYYQIGGNQYGPRFLFEAYPFLVIFVVRSLLEVKTRWSIAALLVCAIYPVVKLPFIAYRESKIVDQRQDLYDLVKAEKITNAVVFVNSPTSPLRPMPADDLTRNDPAFNNDVLYVLSLPSIDSAIMNYYEDRSFYRYTRDLNSVHGTLERVR